MEIKKREATKEADSLWEWQVEYGHSNDAAIPSLSAFFLFSH